VRHLLPGVPRDTNLIMSDRARWDLRGPVRTVDVHRTWRYSRRSPESDACELTESGDHSVVEFNPDGAISRHWHRNPDNSEITSTHAYDPAGRLVSIQSETYLSLYEYDQHGRLTRHLSRDADGQERTIDTYSYDDEGRQTKTHSAPQPEMHARYAVEGSQAFYSAHGAATLTTSYNHAGGPTQLLFHDAAGALLSHVEFLYDASGNLIEETQIQAVSPFAKFEENLPPVQLEALRAVLCGPFTQRKHRYDALGNRIETISSMFGSLGRDRETLEYNRYGDPIAQTSEHESLEYGFPDEGGPLESRPGEHHRSEARFVYEYDPHGNWLTKITESRHGDNPDFSVSSTERRTPTYFDPI
jgi:YD repeat-containing protein